MTLSEIRNVLEAEVLCGDELLHREAHSVFASDLISEMLVYLNPNALIITSLTNAHVAHTAQVMDAAAVVFAGGKKPDESVITNSQASGIPLLTTKHLTFECCGRLFLKGLDGTACIKGGPHVTR